MVNRLVDTGRKYGMEINIDKSQVMRVSRRNESLQIKVNTGELKEVVHSKYLGSVLTIDGHCTREIKMRIAIAKEAFNRKMSLLTGKLCIELKKKLARCYVWSIALYGSKTWTLRKLEQKYLESFEMWCWRRMEKIKMVRESNYGTNECL